MLWLLQGFCAALVAEGVFVVRGGRLEDSIVRYVGEGRKEGRKKDGREGLFNVHIAQQCMYQIIPRDFLKYPYAF